MDWYVFQEGEQLGPFDIETIINNINEGNLTDEHFLWNEGLTDWVRAGDIEELKSYFESVQEIKTEQEDFFEQEMDDKYREEFICKIHQKNFFNFNSAVGRSGEILLSSL